VDCTKLWVLFSTLQSGSKILPKQYEDLDPSYCSGVCCLGVVHVGTALSASFSLPWSFVANLVVMTGFGGF